MNFRINNVLCTSLEDVKKCASQDFCDFVEEYYNSSDFVIAHSSGSTGAPKSIKLKKSDMRVSAYNTNKFFHLNTESTFLLSLSPKYIAGKMMIVRALELNANIIEVAPSNKPLPDGFVEHIDLAAFVPSQVDALLNDLNILSKINNIIIGGAAVSDSLKRRISNVECKNTLFYQTYGMTETCSHIALRAICNEDVPYKVIGNISIESDARGCLVASLPEYSIGRVVTNDIVSIVDDKHFYWRGRYDNVINSGGIKVFPEEVESKMARVLKHVKFYITGTPSDKWGEEVTLVIEYNSLNNGEIKMGNVTENLISELKKILPAYAVPRKYIAVNKFNYTSSGKLLRDKTFSNRII